MVRFYLRIFHNAPDGSGFDRAYKTGGHDRNGRRASTPRGCILWSLLRHLTNNPASQLCPSISWASSARKILFESGKTQLSQPTSPATHGYALPPISMTIPLFDIPCVASRMTLARPLCRTETLRPCNQRCSGARSFSRESDYLALLASEPRRTQRYDKGTCRPRYCPLSLSQGTSSLGVCLGYSRLRDEHPMQNG